ncbi:MAG: hypothetical protein P4L45_09110, partial [Ignavibacteriaceae bacterium]|nr:hypothetical protein [Ignavibacteriaceae bacterium]
QVTTQDYNPGNAGSNSKPVLQPKAATSEKDKVADTKQQNSNEPESASEDNKKTEPVNQVPAGAFYSLSDASADTSSLDQIYNEPTLNVTIKYPAGWTYIDQNVNKRLDGVTFWSNIGNFTPPPYINLEVRDKDLFDESRYKYNTWTWGFTIYYNDPEEMENQVTQIFYIRTNAGEDFSLKLIMKGKEEFKAFQPVFFGMMKSFKFGKGLF